MLTLQVAIAVQSEQSRPITFGHLISKQLCRLMPLAFHDRVERAGPVFSEDKSVQRACRQAFIQYVSDTLGSQKIWKSAQAIQGEDVCSLGRPLSR